MFSPKRSIRHWQRYSEIVAVFFKHGFEFVLNQVEPEWPALRRVLHLPFNTEGDRLSDNLVLHLRLALQELGPTFIKLGQILSTRPDMLPASYIAELSKLQDDIPAAPWENIREVIVRELQKTPEALFQSIEAQPMAVASLSQVYAALLPDGEEVVVKVQRPGVEKIVETDLEILTSLAARAQATRLGKLFDFVSMADDFSYTLKNELDYYREGRNADQFRKNFSHESCLYIPKIYWEYSAKRVIVLERIRGIKVDNIEAMDQNGYDRHQIALNSARIIFKEILEDGFFHADPHPGNYCVLPGEVIGAMDFGMVGYLREQDRLDLARLYLVIVALDTDGLVDQLVRMGSVPAGVERAGLALDINRLLNKYYNLPLKEIKAHLLLDEIMNLSFSHHLKMPNNFWLLTKTFSMMEGIGLRLDPDFDVFETAKPFVNRLVRQLAMPNQGWVRAAILGSANWGDFFNHLPRAGNRLLEHIEKNEPVRIHIEEANHLADVLDRVSTRLSLSILVASLILGLAMLIPSTSPDSWTRWIIISGLVASFFLGGWLFLSVIRSKH